MAFLRRRAEADSKQKVLQGRGESQRILQEGLAEAAVLLRRVASYGDPRLYAMTLVANELAHSAQPLVPERVFVSSSAAENGGSANGSAPNQGMFGVLLQMLVADKTAFQPTDTAEISALKTLADRLAGDALATLENGHAT